MALIHRSMTADATTEKLETRTMEQAEAMLARLPTLVAQTSPPNANEQNGNPTAPKRKPQVVSKKAPRRSVTFPPCTSSSEHTPRRALSNGNPESRRTSTKKGSPKAAQAGTASPPTALIVLEEILGIDVRARIEESSTQCLAETKVASARCKIHVRAQNKEQILASVEALSKREVGAGAEELAAFVELTCCGRHHRKKALAKIEEWKRMNLILTAKEERTSTPASTKIASSSAASSRGSPASGGEPLSLPSRKEKKAPKQIAHEKPKKAPNRDVILPFHPRYDLRSNRNMTKYGPNCRCYYCTSSPIRVIDAHLYQLLMRPLTAKALKRGYIYVYRFLGEKDFFKIGYTTIDLLKRRMQWEQQCGHEIEMVYLSDDVGGLPISNVYRVEQLIHAELKAYRYREKGCQGCGKNHTEWFNVSEEHVRAVIEKWVGWIGEEPYGEKGGIWKMKTQQMRDVDRMCTPLAAPVGILEADWEPPVPVRRSTLIRSVDTRFQS